MIATARVQPAEARSIFTGKHEIVKPVDGKRFEIVQLLDMAVADMAPGLMAFPDQRGVMRLRVFLGGVDEGRVPAPAVGAGQADAALEQIHRRLIAHAASRGDIIGLAVFDAGAGVDDDDLERLQSRGRCA